MCGCFFVCVCVCLFSVQLQPTRASVSLQHGTVQTVWKSERCRVFRVSTQYRRTTLSVLQAGLLPRQLSAHDTSQDVPRSEDVPSLCTVQFVRNSFFIFKKLRELVTSCHQVAPEAQTRE